MRGLVYANGSRGHGGVAALITVKIKRSGLLGYCGLISGGTTIIVCVHMDLALPERGDASQHVMTFGQSHTNKQPGETIRCNYNYCICLGIHNHSRCTGDFSGVPDEYQ